MEILFILLGLVFIYIGGEWIWEKDIKQGVYDPLTAFFNMAILLIGFGFLGFGFAGFLS